MADTVRRLLRGLGQTLMTLGVVLALFCVYELQVTNLYTDGQQEVLADELQDTWSGPVPPVPPPSPSPTPAPTTPVPTPTIAPPPTPAPAVDTVAVAAVTGGPLTVLRVPRFGDDYRKVVVEGVGVRQLKRGPGHYPGTALPGALGNVVLSGHRTTYGAPFNRLDELRPGDALVLETRDSWFTYRMTGVRIVPPTAVEVTYPVPGRRGAAPRERLLTLTTCHPEYSARQRMVVSASLEQALRKGPGVVPPALSTSTGGA